MENIINLGIPHVGEQIFESLDTPELFNCLEVSETWRELAENVLIKRWKGKMFEACKSGETKIVQLLLECCNSEKSGLHSIDEYGYTAFMWACQNGHKDVVQLLLENSERIELNAISNHRWTAFRTWKNQRWTAVMLACSNRHTDVIKLLLDHSEIELNLKDNGGMTAFIHACRNGHKDVVKLMLDHSERIELNERSSNGYTAFMIACLNGHKEVVQFLLDHSESIDMNARSNDGRNAFMEACYHGRKDVVKLLLEYSEQNIDLNIEENDLIAALMTAPPRSFGEAPRRGHHDIVQMIKPKLSFSSQLTFFTSTSSCFPIFLLLFSVLYTYILIFLSHSFSELKFF